MMVSGYDTRELLFDDEQCAVRLPSCLKVAWLNGANRIVAPTAITVTNSLLGVITCIAEMTENQCVIGIDEEREPSVVSVGEDRFTLEIDVV